jgi:hypothetical protein
MQCLLTGEYVSYRKTPYRYSVHSVDWYPAGKLAFFHGALTSTFILLPFMKMAVTLIECATDVTLFFGDAIKFP